MDTVQRKEKMTKENVNNNKTEKRNQDGGKTHVLEDEIWWCKVWQQEKITLLTNPKNKNDGNSIHRPKNEYRINMKRRKKKKNQIHTQSLFRKWKIRYIDPPV